MGVVNDGEKSLAFIQFLDCCCLHAHTLCVCVPCKGYLNQAQDQARLPKCWARAAVLPQSTWRWADALGGSALRIPLLGLLEFSKEKGGRTYLSVARVRQKT